MESGTICFPGAGCIHPFLVLFIVLEVELIGFALINIALSLRESYKKGQLKLFRRHPLKVAHRVEAEKPIDQEIPEGLTTLIFLASVVIVFVMAYQRVDVTKVSNLLALSAIIMIGVFIPVREALFRVINEELDRWELVRRPSQFG